MAQVFVILGNQLFPAGALPRGARVFMAEDRGLCTYVKHHKQKLVLFLAAMRGHRDELLKRDIDVHYVELDPDTNAEERYEDKLGRYLDERGDVDTLKVWEIEDKFFERRIETFAQDRGLKLETLPSPMFVTARDEGKQWLAKHRPFMAEFYKWQRTRLKILVDDGGNPTGGRWSFDEDNRQVLPAEVEPPGLPNSRPSDHVRDVIALVDRLFGDHPGELSLSSWWLPTTRQQALAWLRGFLEHRFASFGPYEDALSSRDPFLFHAVLTPVLNLGLITPREVIDRALTHAHQHDVPLASLEGFVRQIIGWREFIRLIYQEHSEQQESRNFFGHTRKLGPQWYRGDTGLRPLDDVIAKANRYGYAHHIERLMVAANLMTLCEIEPREAHRWFMEMFVDSSDWVMGPNVYGMGLFSDGGIFATKPYICGSNYMVKMSDHYRGRGHTEWRHAVDGLYWRFVARHRDYFSSQPRLSRIVSTLDRMGEERRETISEAAEQALQRITR